MPRRQRQERSRYRTAVLLIDVVNAFDFDGSGPLVRAAERAAPHIDALAGRARAAHVPVVYVNDNFGRWRSDFAATVRTCTARDVPGRAVSERLRPHPGDLFVLKPQHSGFYSTPLELLLSHLEVHTLVLTGFAADICVLFTANDAHMRGYQIVVPRDCTAANSPSITRRALAHVETALHGDTRASPRIAFGELARRRRKPRGQTF
jgi:nicotinamidase-related amidase